MTNTKLLDICQRERIWLLIPAYNVSKHIEELLGKTKNFIPPEQTILINDGSTDETARIARQFPVQIIEHKINLGKGVALKTGIDCILRENGQWIITMDGDLQHEPSCLADFILEAERNKADIVIGARRRNQEMPWDRRFSNGFTSLFISLMTGRKIKDVQSGYRLIRVEMLAGLEFRSRKYDFEAELLLKCIRKGARIGHVEIPTRYSSESSSINRSRDTLRFMAVILKYMMRSDGF